MLKQNSVEQKKITELEYYELGLYLNPYLNKQEISTLLQLYKEFFIAKGSTLVLQKVSKTKLSYPIRGFENTTSIDLLFVGTGELIKEIDKKIYRDDSILRHFVSKTAISPLSLVV